MEAYLASSDVDRIREEIRSHMHTPASVGHRVGVPKRSASVILSDLANHGDVIEVLPGVYTGSLRALVLPAAVIFLAVLGLSSLMALL